MDIRIIAVPYDSGRRAARMGAGPERLLRAGLERHLTSRGHAPTTETVTLADDVFPAEGPVAFALNAALAARVAAAVAEGCVPLVLAGNCTSALGTVAGLGDTDIGVFWFDAHGDFNTPETTVSGFLDGMALATLAGRCWRQAAARVPGFAPVPEDRIVLLGARDLDADEARALAASAVTLLPPDAARGDIGESVAQVAGRVARAYVHVDLDVLDPSEARANALAAPGGLSVAEVRGAVAEIAARVPLAAVAFTAYDPECDRAGRMPPAAFAILDQVLDGWPGSKGRDGT